MKVCSKCKAEKPDSNFPKSGGKGRLSSWCRLCHSERNRQRLDEARMREIDLAKEGQLLLKKMEMALKDHGISKAHLAREIGITPQNLSRWFKNGSLPRKKNLEAACSYLGIKIPMELMANNESRLPLGIAVCESCGKEFPIYKLRVKHCSRECSGHSLSQRQIGAANAKWKGGEIVTKKLGGYIKQLTPGHPAADASGYVLQHRLVMEEVIGRPLKKSERVHHKNGKRDDNRPENLELWTGTGTSKKDPHGIRMVDKVIDLLDSLTPAERRKVEKRIKELDK